MLGHMLQTGTGRLGGENWLPRFIGTLNRDWGDGGDTGSERCRAIITFLALLPY
jgi:hypothetical protein